MIVKDNGGGDFEEVPVGNHVARCIRLIDLGTQENNYNGELSYKRQVLIGFETPNEILTKGDFAGKPFVISKFYTASLGQKANLRHDLVSWRSREFTESELEGFNLSNILDKGCMINVIKKGQKNRSIISTITSLPKGMTIGERVHPIINFSIDEFDAEVFNGLSTKLQDMIKKSPEYKEIVEGKKTSTPDGDFDDDIPF